MLTLCKLDLTNLLPYSKGVIMMPLTMAKAGELNFIKKIIGKEDIKRFLESLGFVTGSNVTVITKNNGNVIVNVKESRIAISQELANKIMV